MKSGILKKLLIFTGIGVIGLGIYKFVMAEIALLTDFQWVLQGFNIESLSSTLAKGTVTIRFQSIADVQFTVKEFILQLYFNGENVGYIQDVAPFLIPANGYNDIPFEFDIDPQFIIDNAVYIVEYATKQKDASIGLQGYVSISSGFISTTVPINCTCSMISLDCSC